MINLILSSSSKARKQVLKQLGIPFKVYHPNIDETPFPKETPRKLLERLAKNKAIAAKNKYKNALIIGSDQIALLKHPISGEFQIFGKPRNHQDAVAMLKKLSGQRVVFFTSLCLYNSSTQKIQLSMEKFTVIFRAFNNASIKRYLAKENPYDCAACIKIEGPGISLIDAIYSQDPTTLLGLPLIKLTKMLEKENIHVV